MEPGLHWKWGLSAYLFSSVPVKMLPFILRDAELFRYCSKCLELLALLLKWHLLICNVYNSLCLWFTGFAQCFFQPWQMSWDEWYKYVVHTRDSKAKCWRWHHRFWYALILYYWVYCEARLRVKLHCMSWADPMAYFLCQLCTPTSLIDSTL